jgi:hypothetical protein
MAKIVATVKGKKLDMTKLKLQNENVITVGNMKTNARGDKLDPKTGKVIKTRNQIKSEQYRLHTNVPVNLPVSEQTIGVDNSQGNKKK